MYVALLWYFLLNGQFWPLDQEWDLSHLVSNCESWINIILSFVKVIRIQSANFFYHVDVYVLNLSLVSS